MKFYYYLFLFLLFSCNAEKDYDTFENKLKNLLKSHKGTFAIALKNMDDGKSILINENEVLQWCYIQKNLNKFPSNESLFRLKAIRLKGLTLCIHLRCLYLR